MLRANQFKPIQARLVAFTPNIADFRQSEILVAVLGRFSERFAGEIQSLPLPENVPADVPRIQLSSPDGEWLFSASPSRLTAQWKQQIGMETTVGEAVQNCQDVILEHVHQNEVQIGRLAFVLTRTAPSGSGAQDLIDRFCKDEVKDPDLARAPLRGSRNFELHNHKQYTLPIDDLAVNSWVRCKTGTVTATQESVVIVEHDINTLAEKLEECSFSETAIQRFYEAVVRETDDILNKYFPG